MGLVIAQTERKAAALPTPRMSLSGAIQAPNVCRRERHTRAADGQSAVHAHSEARYPAQRHQGVRLGCEREDHHARRADYGLYTSKVAYQPERRKGYDREWQPRRDFLLSNASDYSK